jgi:hypothetical protein
LPKFCTRTNYEASPTNAILFGEKVSEIQSFFSSVSTSCRKKKGVLHVLDADVLGTKDHPNDVKTKGVTGTLKARHPDFRRAAELALLAPAHGGNRTAEGMSCASLNLDERYRSARPSSLASGRNQIDIAVPILEPALGDLPTVDV